MSRFTLTGTAADEVISALERRQQAIDKHAAEVSELTDALDHICRVARASTTQSRRDRWIAERARCALEGEDWRDIDIRVRTGDRGAKKRELIGLLRVEEKLRRRENPFACASLDCIYAGQTAATSCLCYSEQLQAHLNAVEAAIKEARNGND